MKNALLIGLIKSLFLIGCSPVLPPPNENVNLLYERFHGKYEVIQSVSNEAIDVNLDGKATNDMLVEIPELSEKYRNYLELRIYGKSTYNPDLSFLFVQWWPEQYIWVNNKRWEGESLDYQPGLIVNYAMQGSTRRFSFSPDLKQITVQSDETQNSFRWVKPESVTVNADNTIQVVNKRRLYTSAGVNDVVITTLYKRYTMIT